MGRQRHWNTVGIVQRDDENGDTKGVKGETRAQIQSSMRFMMPVLCVFLQTMTIVRRLHDILLSVRHRHTL